MNSGTEVENYIKQNLSDIIINVQYNTWYVYIKKFYVRITKRDNQLEIREMKMRGFLREARVLKEDFSPERYKEIKQLIFDKIEKIAQKERTFEDCRRKRIISSLIKKNNIK